MLPDQWPRALLRAELREHGYDAVGARTLAEAFAQLGADPDRGPVRLMVVDRDAVTEPEAAPLKRLLERHAEPVGVLLTRAGADRPDGRWGKVISRPVSIAEITQAIRDLLPLPPDARHAVD